VAGEKSARIPRFVRTSGDTKVLHEASLASARRLAGLKGYVTNIPAELMPAGEVIASYHDLWRVEQSFRMSKTDLRRPMFHHTRDAIEAHLTIVFTALDVAREAQTRTGLAIGILVRQLRPLHSPTIAINGTTQTFTPAIGPAQQTILDAVNATGLTHKAIDPTREKQSALSVDRLGHRLPRTLEAPVAQQRRPAGIRLRRLDLLDPGGGYAFRKELLARPGGGMENRSTPSTVTAREWAAGLRAEGKAGMRDRSSRPRFCPHQTSEPDGAPGSFDWAGGIIEDGPHRRSLGRETSATCAPSRCCAHSGQAG
jgi:hypothetical protein